MKTKKEKAENEAFDKLLNSLNSEQIELLNIYIKANMERIREILNE